MNLPLGYVGAKMRKNGRILPREEDAGVAYSVDGARAPSQLEPSEPASGDEGMFSVRIRDTR